MWKADSLYRLLLRLYPAAFRRDYEDLLRQSFRDQQRASHPHLWRRTVLDLLRSIPTEHLHEIRRHRPSLSATAALLFAAAGTAFLGRFELRSDDSGVEVAFVLLFTCILGCWRPHRAWRSALLCLVIPAVELPHSRHLRDIALLALVMLLLGLIGTYTGVLFRKLATARA